MNKREILRKLIINLEFKEIDIEEVTKENNKFLEKGITKDDIIEYWGSTSVDELIDRLLIRSIDNWQEINDSKALELIEEILANIDNDMLLERNTDALEKKFQKSSGTIIDWIFQDDIVDSKEILNKLKGDNTIFL